MISTVLYETNGVITEERFQKMTPVQWNFHYMIIQQERADRVKAEFRNDILMQDLLARTIESLAVVINKDMAKPYLESSENIRQDRNKRFFDLGNYGQKNSDDVNVSNVNVKDEKAVQRVMDKYYDPAPSVINVPASVFEKDKYFLPKFNKETVLQKGRRKFIGMKDTETVKPEIAQKPKRRHIPE